MVSRGTTITDPELPVRLTDDDRAERAISMAAKVLHIAALREKKRVDAKATQDLIDEDLDELERLARVLTEDQENRKQGDLQFGESEAMDALHGIAQRACTCEGGAEAEIKSPACPVHGVNGKAETHVEGAEPYPTDAAADTHGAGGDGVDQTDEPAGDAKEAGGA